MEGETILAALAAYAGELIATDPQPQARVRRAEDFMARLLKRAASGQPSVIQGHVIKGGSA